MREIILNPYAVAQTYIGLTELPGAAENHPHILAMLQQFNSWPETDEVPWCSAFVAEVALRCRCSLSRSLKARSWLGVGRAVDMPELGDVVILRRGDSGGGPEDMDSPGHVGFWAGFSESSMHWLGRESPRRQFVHVLGGNQKSSVNVQQYPIESVLGYRDITVSR